MHNNSNKYINNWLSVKEIIEELSSIYVESSNSFEDELLKLAQLGWRKKYLKYIKREVRINNYAHRLKKLVELYCECTDIFIQINIRQEVYSHLQFSKKYFDRLVEDYHRDKKLNFEGMA